MNTNTVIPQPVLNAFPQLKDAIFVRRLASPVPLVPDTTFDIFIMNDKNFIAFVTTDYADPAPQSLELKQISGQYEFVYKNLFKPFSRNEFISIFDHDDMEGDFLVKVDATYYYVANITSSAQI